MQNIINKRFGHLVVLDNAPASDWGNKRVECRCDCGNVIIRTVNDLTSKKVKSCGCQNKIRRPRRTFKKMEIGQHVKANSELFHREVTGEIIAVRDFSICIKLDGRPQTQRELDYFPNLTVGKKDVLESRDTG